MPKCRFVLAAVLLVSIAGGPAAAQVVSTPAAPTPPPRPAGAFDPDSQKSAFLAMPEADRKAAQDALVWLGLYNGVVDGAFGKRTLDSILAYQASLKAPSDGVLSSAQLAGLKTSAQKARAALGFQSLDDARTGIRIGAPLKLLDKRTAMGGQTQLTNRDGSVSLDLIAPPGALAALYAKLSAETPDRKVSYKAMKADAFFVVSGEEGRRKFYLRYAAAPAGAPDAGALRGFEFVYPLAETAEFDRVALAIANAFEPFPAKSEPGKTVEPPLDASKAPEPSPTPSEPVLTATALILAPGQAATMLSEADCKAPTIQGKPVKFIRAEASGFAVLGGGFGGAPASPRLAASPVDLVVLSLAPDAASGKAVLQASDATLATSAVSRPTAVVALAKSARGAPAFDRQGALAAFVAASSVEPKRRGEVVLAEPHGFVSADEIHDLVTSASVQTVSDEPPLGAADIARKMRGAIVGVYCVP